MSKEVSFEIQWKKYMELWWSKYCPMDFEDLFSLSSILCWGVTSYLNYKKSSYFKKDISIETDNQEIDVYFLVRKIQEGNFLFFFVNTIEFKQSLEMQKINDRYNPHQVNLLFLKRGYDHCISMQRLFDHEYSYHCWCSLKEMK